MPADLDQLTCPGCGYALRGLPDNICPECGQAFDAQAMLRELRHPSRADRALMSATVALVTGICSVPLTILFGLHAVRPTFPYACGRSRGLLDGDPSLVILVLTLFVPCIAGASTALSPLSPRVLARIARIGVLAAITSWSTLFVILTTAR